MKKVLIGIVIVVVIAGVTYFAFGRQQFSTAAEPTVEAAPVSEPVVAGRQIIADAVVVPVERAELSLAQSGIVAEVLVAEDDQIEAGQVLLRLESSRQAAEVAQAEAQLMRSQAQLAELKAGAREQEIRSAQAALDAAQERLNRAQSDPMKEEKAVAKASLAEAKASLQKLLEGADPKEIIAAEAELSNADAVRRQAQAAYDLVKGSPHIGAYPQAAELEKATNNYIAAEARLEELKQGSDASDIAAARARVRRAQAELDLLSANNPADIGVAEADVRQYQAELDLLAEGARGESIAVAEADVAATEAALAMARANLAQTELRAPFSGTVARLEVSVGEQASAGVPVVWLADLSNWLVETDDLTELNIVRVETGAPVTISFDALPDTEIQGHVIRSEAIGEDKMGDITYTVVIQPEQFDARLRWNMTASVEIEPM